jgi:hypothetical protein
MLPGPVVQQSASALGSGCHGLTAGHRQPQAPELVPQCLHAAVAGVVALGKLARAVVAARYVSGVVEAGVAAAVDATDSPTAAQGRSLWRTAGSKHVDKSPGTRQTVLETPASRDADTEVCAEVAAGVRSGRIAVDDGKPPGVAPGDGANRASRQETVGAAEAPRDAVFEAAGERALARLVRRFAWRPTRAALTIIDSNGAGGRIHGGHVPGPRSATG